MARRNGFRVGVLGALGVSAVVLGAVACGPSERGPVIGSSNAATGGGSSTNLDGGMLSAVPLNPVAMDFRTSMTRVNPSRFLSRGHASGRWDVDVYADKAGAEALRGEHWPVPAGAHFVEEHFERSDGGAGPIMMMEKRAPGFDTAHGDWRYTAIGTKGEVVKDGIVESCAACHGEAPGDHVFRVGGE